MALVGKHVYPVESSGTLAVYAADGKTLIWTHLLVVDAKGRYQTDQAHLQPLTDFENQYLKNEIDRFSSDSDAIGAFANRLVERYGLFAVRRLWLLRGIIKQYGYDLVSQAAQVAKNLHDLTKQVKTLKQGECHESKSQRLPKTLLFG